MKTKTAEEIAKDIADRFFTAYPDSNDVDEIYSTERNRRLSEMIVEKCVSTLWTSPCICPPDKKTGETLCCNHCGKPTARTSEELPGDDNIDDSWSKMFNIKTSVGFVNGAKWMRSIASPLLASKDARIRELEEENKKLKDYINPPKKDSFFDGFKVGQRD